jgi:hypothetical protein
MPGGIVRGTMSNAATTKRRKTGKTMSTTKAKSKAKGKPDAPPSAIKEALKAEIRRRKLTRYAVSKLTGVPMTVCYAFLKEPEPGEPVRGVALKHLDKMFSGLGMTMVTRSDAPASEGE